MDLWISGSGGIGECSGFGEYICIFSICGSVDLVDLPRLLDSHSRAQIGLWFFYFEIWRLNVSIEITLEI